MPDPEKTTVSASQVSALYDASEYTTRWMLWHAFANGVDIEPAENTRMRIGKAMEPVISRLAAEDHALDIRRNDHDHYYRRGPLGCTPDSHVFTCPTRGDGIIETKNVDWLIWKQKWRFDGEGNCVGATDYVELQVQTQMWVMDVSWALIAVLVGGNELLYLERRPDREVQDQLVTEAQRFLASVRAGEAPDPLGVSPEVPILSRIYPEVLPEPVLELQGSRAEEGLALEEWIADALDARRRRKLADDEYTGHRVRILNLCGSHGRVRTPGGWVNVSPQKRVFSFKEG
jgi:hypothetical protein